MTTTPSAAMAAAIAAGRVHYNERLQRKISILSQAKQHGYTAAALLMPKVQSQISTGYTELDIVYNEPIDKSDYYLKCYRGGLHEGMMNQLKEQLDAPRLKDIRVHVLIDKITISLPHLFD